MPAGGHGLGCATRVPSRPCGRGGGADLGAGGGIDAFLAAREVGAAGRVIGIDMTPNMVSKARHNAEWGGSANVGVRLGD